jgi:hypothetical protein
VTTPFISAPDGSFVVGTISGIQSITEATMKAALKLPVLPSFTAVQANVVSEVKQPTSDVAAAAITTTVIVGQTVARSVYTTSGTWTRPVTPAGKRISRIAAAAINGGQGGVGPVNGNGGGGEGGEGGGYTYKEFADADVPSSVAVTVGAGGTGGGNNQPGASGGVSSFGTLVAGKQGVANVLTAQGAIGSTCTPGNGGNGGSGEIFAGSSTNVRINYAGLRGGSSALAVGGAGGAGGGDSFNNGIAGSAGGPAATDTQIVSGGGGGGGGGGTSAQSGLNGGSNGPGAGGAGGAPGGGGGGAGGGKNNAGSRPGGNGGNGCVAVWTFFEDVLS